MRKVFAKARFRKHSQKRANAELKNRQTRDGRVYRLPARLRIRRILVVPRYFDVINNSTEVLDFFDRFKSLVSVGYRVYLDMENVTYLGPDAILCLLATLEELRFSYPLDVQGSSPKEQWCSELLRDSGFYKYVSAPSAPAAAGNAILSIRQGFLAHTSEAKALKHFAVKHTGGNIKGLDAKAVYTTIIECMANTKNHSHRSSPRRWRMLAAVFHSPEGRRSLRFAFHDNGVGIPSTVKRKSLFRDAVATDAQLIVAAFTQAFRSETGLSYRGKGLPRILSFQERGLIDNFAVMSRMGLVDFSKKTSRGLDTSFQGTLLVWDFISNFAMEDTEAV